jgi:hypothetical protein
MSTEQDCRRFLELSREMLAAARGGRWDRLELLEQRRGIVLSCLEDGLAQQRELSAWHELIRAALEVNEQIRECGAEELRDLGRRLADLHFGRQARAAYAEA